MEAPILPTINQGQGAPTLVLMHFLGGSKREWAECIKLLSPHHRCVALDLPGFGEAADISGYTVGAMVLAVQNTLAALDVGRFVLVGHSMSGKIAMGLAAEKPAGLVGLILVGPSPPSPEPMKDESRKKMLAMKRDRASAETFLDGITAHPLTGKSRANAIEDFITCSADAWTAWLETGSREDWREDVGLVSSPALIVTGTADPSLSASVQQKTTMKSLTCPRLEIIEDCGHLPTMEAPEKLAALMAGFVAHGIALR